MKTLTDVTCNRCGCTESLMWVDPSDARAAHACPDGGRSDSFSVSTRIVMGPGERCRDDERSGR